MPCPKLASGMRALLMIAMTSLKKIIIPGVGAFPNCIREFNSRGYRQILCDHVNRGGGVLGICVGHQMLFSSSEEFELTKGLSIFDGVVERLDRRVPNFWDLCPTLIGFR